jgi:pyruvate dehydrogenase complex dehydrogenase (E1) component
MRMIDFNMISISCAMYCNLRRLDGPVRGNEQIIQELESLQFISYKFNCLKNLRTFVEAQSPMSEQCTT